MWSLSFLTFSLSVLTTYTNAAVPAGTREDLTSLLSSSAQILTPEAATFASFTTRWTGFNAPIASLVVVPANADDVAKTVKYASSKKITFLTQSGKHGWGDLSSTTEAIFVDISRLNAVNINTGANEVTVGGGVKTGDTIAALLARGKQMQTGTCDCVGLLGAGLGAGYGRFQGLKGYIIDNMLSAKVVLWSGKTVTASASNLPDLFWGLKGAGHNFGVVVEAKYRIWDQVNNGKAFVADWVYPKAAIKEVIAQTNSVVLPPQATIWLFVRTDPVTHDVNVLLSLVYIGSETAGRALLQKYYGAIKGGVPKKSEQVAAWDKINALVGEGVLGISCQSAFYGLLKDSYTTGTKRIDPQAGLEFAVKMEEFVKANPATTTNTLAILEYYPHQGVRAVPDDSTAYPHRAMNVMSLLVVISLDPSIMNQVATYGRESIALLNRNSGNSTPMIYVNYARGDEPLQQIYGTGSRLSKLTELKRRYDPGEMFSQYNPIPLRV